MGLGWTARIWNLNEDAIKDHILAPHFLADRYPYTYRYRAKHFHLRIKRESWIFSQFARTSTATIIIDIYLYLPIFGRCSCSPWPRDPLRPFGLGYRIGRRLCFILHMQYFRSFLYLFDRFRRLSRFTVIEKSIVSRSIPLCRRYYKRGQLFLFRLFAFLKTSHSFSMFAQANPFLRYT